LRHYRPGPSKGKVSRDSSLYCAEGVTDTSLWNALLEACKESGQFERGYKHFDEMKAMGERPNLTTFNTMASLAAKGGNVSLVGVKGFRILTLCDGRLKSEPTTIGWTLWNGECYLM
jgi:pentatricopeptide repeat protein